LPSGSRDSNPQPQPESSPPMSLIRYQLPGLSTRPAFRRSSPRNDWERLFEFAFPAPETAASRAGVPALDLYETEDAYVAKLEVPGVKNEDVDITLHEGVLTVSGTRQSEFGAEAKTSFRTERTFGKFERSVGLPAPVDATRVKATSKDGVLTVTL